MNDQQLMQNESAQLNRRAFWILFGTAVFMVVLWIISLLFAATPGFSATRDVSLGILTAVSLLSAGLARSGRVHIGIWLLVGANYAISLWYVWFNTSGLGPVIGVLALLISGGIASTTLPQRYVNRTIIGTIIGTILIIIGDLFSPVSRPASTNTQSITIITFVSLSVYGIFILRQFRHYTLRTKLGILFVSIGTLSVAAVGSIVSRVVQEAITIQVVDSLTQQTEKLSDFMGAVFIQKVAQIQALSTVDTIKETLEQRNETYYAGDESQILAALLLLDEQWIQAGDDDPLIENVLSQEKHINPVAFQLHNFLKSFPEQTELFVTDKYGATVGATNRLSDYYQADETWWQAAWNDGEGAIYLSDPEFDESAGVTAIQIALPIVSDGDNEILGIARSTLILNDLFAVVADVQIGETGHGVLLDRAGNVLFENLTDDEVGTQGVALELRQEFLEGQPHSEVAEDENGDLAVFAHAPIHIEGFAEYEEEGAFGGDGREVGEPSEFETAVAQAVAQLGWAIVLRQETDEAFVTVSRVSTAVTLIGLVVVSLLVVIAAVFATSLTRPLRALGEAASAIAEGNLDVPLPPAGQDEIGQLTAEFANMTRQLQQIVGELQQRTLVIETSSEVSRHLSTILNEQELMTAVVNQVQRGFNYYHAHIYLLDEQNNRLRMAAGTGQAAQEMLAQRHRIRMGEGLVGRAAQTKATVLVPDVRQDPNWLPNSLLPETKSEIAVPIILGAQVLGVLDVQHNSVNGLKEQDADLLQLLANQIAIALQNARLFTQTQQQATQQALINEIGRKIQAAPTVERVLRTAAEELGQALNIQRTTIQLNSHEQKNGR